jgi:hypothetical protein
MNNAWMGRRIAAKTSFLSVGRSPARPVPAIPDIFGAEIAMLTAAHYTKSYKGNWRINAKERGPVYAYTPPLS